ncbi:MULTISPECIES: YihY/virulence factor BrkB family protein [unclassified Jeotgalibaca]|uniref:YihY/virulence factor BrkB family protein n=1 Tax=unclassified Jeotgalibaca TaxID=2621505 RepID=UPI003FD2685E
MKNYTFSETIKIAQKHFKRAEVGRQSAELAYYTLLALFPVLLALANVIPLLPLPTEQILEYVQMAVPDEVGTVILPILEGYLSGGSGGAISLGVIISLWPASKAFSVFQRVLNQVYDTEPRKNFIITRIFSFLTAVLMVSLMAVVAFIFVFGREILELVQSLLPVDILGVITAFEQVRWIIAFATLIMILAFVYYFIPNVKWGIKYALPGAVFATVGFLLISQLFSLYISIAGGASIGTGTIGVFIVLMIWLFLLGNVFIIGGAVNVIYYDYTHQDELVVDEDFPYVSHIFSERGKQLMLKKQPLRRTLTKENNKIKMNYLPGQTDPNDWIGE